MAQPVHLGRQSDDIVQVYRQQALLTRPELKTLTTLDQEMANILARTDLTSNQKMKLFHSTLQRFTSIRNNILEQGSMLPPPPAPRLNVTNDEIPAADILEEGAVADDMAIVKAFKALLKRPSVRGRLKKKKTKKKVQFKLPDIDDDEFFSMDGPDSDDSSSDLDETLNNTPPARKGRKLEAKIKSEPITIKRVTRSNTRTKNQDGSGLYYVDFNSWNKCINN
jgi:hypothetical protein